MTSPTDLAPTDRERLARGVALFNERRFWEAHEAWEDAWLASDGLDRFFWQGLIQLAAAYHKGLVMKSPSGMASLFGHAREKLEHVARRGARLHGVHLDPLCRAAANGQRLAQHWADGAIAAFDETQVTAIELA